jgi:hypothetical protein
MAWRLARSLVQLLSEVNGTYPSRSRASDGTIGDVAHSARASDHNPNSAGVVCAVDITHDPDHGVNGNTLARLAIADRRTKYVIWNRRIWSRDRAADGWRRYDGVNPHVKHVHISVGPRAALYDSTARWLPAAPAPAQEDDTMETIGPGSDRNTVKLLQRCLINEAAANGQPNPLPRFGVDGIWGDELIGALGGYRHRRGIWTSKPDLCSVGLLAFLTRYEHGGQQ